MSKKYFTIITNGVDNYGNDTFSLGFYTAESEIDLYAQIQVEYECDENMQINGKDMDIQFTEFENIKNFFSIKEEIKEYHSFMRLQDKFGKLL